MPQLSSAQQLMLDLAEYSTEDDLSEIFIQKLGWGNPSPNSITIQLDNKDIVVKHIAELSGFSIFEFVSDSRVNGLTQREIDQKISLYRADRLVIFSSPEGQTWRWPKVTASNSISQEVLPIRSGKLPSVLIQRLTGIGFNAQELIGGVNLTKVRDKVRGQFDSSTVTKKFYDQFKVRHDELEQSIEGISDQPSRTSYTTLILNRLMFLYFLQKKGFLNNDLNYLRTCLSKIRELNGSNKFYEFYKDCLLPMCFEGLNKSDGSISDENIRKIVGKVPYVNGGLFDAHEIEITNDVHVPDSSFEKIFDFFDRFVWHLDTRLTGNPNEINPDVLGYIFEQYINFTTNGRRDNGAYYTKSDVTSFMCDSTLSPKIIEVLLAAGVDVFKIIQENPVDFLIPAILHGFDHSVSDWKQPDSKLLTCWLGDPTYWTQLDTAETDEEFCLKSESWVETFHRRERVKDVLNQLSRIDVVNDLITLPVDMRMIISASIDSISSEKVCSTVWKSLSKLSLLDPTCGSGAFLFAALEIFEDAYLHIIDKSETFNPKKGSELFELNQIVKTHFNNRYFVRKHTALHNLFGTDLMEDAIETAKLRIFLALVACVDRIEELEPLPDLDFNLRSGNLLVGFSNELDSFRVGGDLLTSESLNELGPSIQEYLKSYRAFIDESSKQNSSMGISKDLLKRKGNELRDRANIIYANCLRIEDDEKIKAFISKSKPMHWFLEFPGIISNGGFDVIVGNPPYIKKSDFDSYDIVGFQTNNCPDIFANCYERSLSLLSPKGRHSFIVMLNLAFSDDYLPLRRLIAERSGSEWWSTYGKRPDSLFTGVQVRNTILILAPGKKKYVTRHNIFTSISRAQQFGMLEYVEGSFDSSLRPLRAGVAEKIVEHIASLPEIHPRRGNPGTLFLRPTGQYWMPALFKNPPIVNDDFSIAEVTDPRTVLAPLADREDFELATAACAGKIGYLWWSSTADDFDVGSKDSLGPRKLAYEFKDDSVLKKSSRTLRDSSWKAAFASLNARKLYLNVRWSSLRDLTDKFDYRLLELNGLESEWRNLNIWYRQVMKSSGENSNSVRVPEEVSKKYI